jgi:hypothetical protein
VRQQLLHGGFGEVPGPLPDTWIECDACPSAYELQSQGETK